MFSDFHNDILTAVGGELTENYLKNNIITAVFRGKRDFNEAVKIATKARLLAFEDVGYEDLNVDKLISLKPIYVGLTWNGENRLGYGCDFQNGLKQEGKELIKKLNKHSIAVDCAHISEGGFKDIIDNAETVVDSHTCFNAVFKHKRNLHDWQLKEIVDRGGLVGVTCYSRFMTDVKQCKISDFIRQIDYFVQKFGADNLAVGTDFYGCENYAEDALSYEKLYRITRKELFKLGYDNGSIDKILCNNLLNFTEKIKRRHFCLDSF